MKKKNTEDQKVAELIEATAKRESTSDAKDMLQLAQMIKKGQHKEAYEFYRSLDTFVREGIPEKAIVYLSLNQSKTRKVIDIALKFKGCKKIFKKGFKPGVLFRAELEFSGNATDEQIAMGLLEQERRLIKELIEFEFSDVRSYRVL